MDEATAAHRSMLGFIAWMNERVPGARIQRSDDELMVTSAHPFPFFRVGCRRVRCGLSQASLAGQISR